MDYLTHSMCERQEPVQMGDKLFIHFVPDFSNADEEESINMGDMVGNMITNSMQKFYNIFKDDLPEAVIQLIYMHESIMAGKKLQERYFTISAIIILKQTQLSTLHSTTDLVCTD